MPSLGLGMCQQVLQAADDDDSRYTQHTQLCFAAQIGSRTQYTYHLQPLTTCPASTAPGRPTTTVYATCATPHPLPLHVLYCALHPKRLHPTQATQVNWCALNEIPPSACMHPRQTGCCLPGSQCRLQLLGSLLGPGHSCGACGSPAAQQCTTITSLFSTHYTASKTACQQPMLIRCNIAATSWQQQTDRRKRLLSIYYSAVHHPHHPSAAQRPNAALTGTICVARLLRLSNSVTTSHMRWNSSTSL